MNSVVFIHIFRSFCQIFVNFVEKNLLKLLKIVMLIVFLKTEKH